MNKSERRRGMSTVTDDHNEDEFGRRTIRSTEDEEDI